MSITHFASVTGYAAGAEVVVSTRRSQSANIRGHTLCKAEAICESCGNGLQERECGQWSKGSGIANERGSFRMVEVNRVVGSGENRSRQTGIGATRHSFLCGAVEGLVAAAAIVVAAWRAPDRVQSLRCKTRTLTANGGGLPNLRPATEARARGEI